MSKKEQIIEELKQAPESVVTEVLDFLRFLKTKAVPENMLTAIASESSLKKDWLTPEEDATWADL